MPALRIVLRKMPQTQRARQIIREELKRGYGQELWPAANKSFQSEVNDWSQQPRFYNTIETRGATLFVFHLRVHKEEEGGLHFWWVNFGTGLEGPTGKTYSIDPVRAPALKFTVPYQPKTIPPGGLLYNPTAPTQWLTFQHINHPGMRPRKISERLFDDYLKRGHRNGFYQVTNRAFKRAFARI